jgi:ATP adenylyltransferase/5',5'''-P-1,P-4-tetraphosphate phosphorylase II
MVKKIIFLKHEWNKLFGQAFDEDRRETKVIPSPDGQGFFRVIYSQKLEGWYQSPRGQARYSKPACFFCEKFDEYHQVDCVRIIDHLEIFFNLKFVMRNHLLIAPTEHRSQPTVTDVATLQKIAAVSGLSIFGNFKNAGASYPRHVHYQTLETEFPVVSRPGKPVYDDHGIRLEILSYPVLAFKLSPLREWAPVSINHAGTVITSHTGTFNLVFYGKDIYLIPRSKSVPANTDGFKFAAAEVCGSIFVRERQLFDVIDGETILWALRDVCLPSNTPEAQHFEDELIKRIKEIMS